MPPVEKYSCRFTGCCVQKELSTVLPGSCGGSIDERASLFLDADIDGSCPRCKSLIIGVIGAGSLHWTCNWLICEAA
ncbi:hypothetical protein D3C83_53080 [compost metagenome]